MSNALFNRLRRNLAELIEPKSDVESPLPPRVRARAIPREIFPDQLKTVLARDQGRAAAGHVNLISLERIKERLGAEWTRLAVNADQIARNAIERYLLPADIYTRWKDGCYVVVFATLDASQAQMKCMMIAEEVARKLLGDEEPHAVDVRAVGLSPDGTIMLADLPEFDTLIALTMADQHAASTADTKDDNTMSSSMMIPGVAAAIDKLDGLRCLYRPVWDPTHSMISTYLAVSLLPGMRTGSGLRAAALELHGDAAAMERLDFVILDRTLHMLDEITHERRRFLIVLPVRFETLASLAQRRRYIDILRNRVTPAIAQLLAIEIMGVPDGIPQSRLHEILTPLRDLSRAILVLLAPETGEFRQFTGAKIGGIGCDISALTTSEAAIMQNLSRFARGATKSGMTAYVHGVRSKSLATAALGEGFTRIDGDAVAPLIAHPKHVVEFNLIDLFNSPAKVQR
jgi:hypothetical protein